jgi:hypothetical protein
MPWRRELGLFAIILFAIILTQLALSRTFDLFTHPLWLDESITWLLTNDPSFAHAMAAVRGGVDTNPPTLYLVLWPLARLTGGLNEVGLRVVSLASVWLAVVGAYAICRRFFDRTSSVIGALALWAHPLVMAHAFEARFYGPWLALAVWYAYVRLDARDDETRAHLALRAALAVALATIHWFGILSLALIEAGDVLVQRRVRFRKLLPAACGFAAVLACVPFLLGQRADLSAKTWIDPPTLSAAKKLFVFLFGTPAMILVVAAFWLGKLTPSTVTPDFGALDRAGEDRAEGLRILLPFSSLLLVFPALVAFSYVMQPALIDRYFIVALAPLCAIAAAMLRDAPSWLKRSMVLALVIIGAAELIGPARSSRGLRQELEKTLAEIDSAEHDRPDVLVVFERRHEMYPLVLRLRPQLSARAWLLDVGDEQDVKPMAGYERDMNRKVARVYPSLRLISMDELRRRGQPFTIVRRDEPGDASAR